MKHLKKMGVVVVASILLIGLTPMGASAQEVTPTSTPVETEESEETYKAQIGESLYVVDYSIGNNGNATVILQSERPQSVTLTEMMVADGIQELNQKTVTIGKGRYELSINVDSSKNQMGFTVATSEGIVGMKDRKTPDWFNGSYSGEQTMLYASFGFFGGIGLVTLNMYRIKQNYTNDVEREL